MAADKPVESDNEVVSAACSGSNVARLRRQLGAVRVLGIPARRIGNAVSGNAQGGCRKHHAAANGGLYAVVYRKFRTLGMVLFGRSAVVQSVGRCNKPTCAAHRTFDGGTIFGRSCIFGHTRRSERRYGQRLEGLFQPVHVSQPRRRKSGILAAGIVGIRQGNGRIRIFRRCREPRWFAGDKGRSANDGCRHAAAHHAPEHSADYSREFRPFDRRCDNRRRCRCTQLSTVETGGCMV